MKSRLKFHHELRAWRQRLDLTQASAAKHLAVPQRTLEGWENGRGPAQPGVVRLAMRCIERHAL